MTTNSGAPLKHLEQPLPPGFSASRHLDALTALVNSRHEGEWDLQVIDPHRKVAIYVPRRSSGEVRSQGTEKIEIDLPRTTKNSDGQKIASQYESQYPGFWMTEFDPFLFTATFTKMDSNTVRARGALSNALGCKPWEVSIHPRIDGGYDVDLPKTYLPSKHDKKLEEVTTQVIGKFGWYINIEASKLHASIIPSDPPTFPDIIPLDLKKLGKGSLDRTPFALKLPAPGRPARDVVAIDWTMSPYVLLGGLPRSGKFLPHSSLVPTPHGWTTHGELRPGSRVFARDGSVVSVLSVTADVTMDMYHVYCADGQILTVGAEHLMQVTSRSPQQRSMAHDMTALADHPRDRELMHNHAISLSDLAAYLDASEDEVREVLADAGAPSEGGLYVTSEALIAWRTFEADGRRHHDPVETICTARHLANTLHDSTYAIRRSEAVILPHADLPVPISIVGRDPQTHLPMDYLRSSVAQRQELWDTLCHHHGYGPGAVVVERHRLACDVLELVRSLGHVASMRAHQGRGYVVSISATDWIDIVDIQPAEPEPAKCIVVDHPEHLYLAEGFIPTHNSVSINDIIADCRSNGSQIVIVTTADKAVDFAWARPFVRDGGWGCTSHRHAITALGLAYEELKRRAQILHERGLQNWYQIPEAERFPPITIIVDEVSMMLMTDRLPPGVDKKLPEVQDVIEKNRLKYKLQKSIYDTMAEMGFVGARMLLSTQVTNATTGLPPTMKALIGNKALSLSTSLPVPASPRFPRGVARLSEIRPGDMVFGSHGGPVRTTGLTPITQVDGMRVSFDDGQWVDTDAGHLWTLERDGKRVTMTTDQARQALARGEKLYLPTAAPVTSYGESAVPIPHRVDIARELCRTGLRDHQGQSLFVTASSRAERDHMATFLRSVGAWAQTIGETQVRVRAPFALRDDLAKPDEPVRLQMIDVCDAGPMQVRCLNVDSDDHLFLVQGFIPTHNCLQGSNPSKTQREQAFNQAAMVPEVPENLRAGGAAAKGVGAAELEGQTPLIYKPFYASTEEVVKRFRELGIAETRQPEPTQEEMDRICPIDDVDDDEERANTPSGKPLDPKFGPVETFNEDGKRLFGAAAAASLSAQIVSDAASVDKLPVCPSCDKPIHPDGRCGCNSR